LERVVVAGREWVDRVFGKIHIFSAAYFEALSAANGDMT